MSLAFRLTGKLALLSALSVTHGLANLCAVLSDARRLYNTFIPTIFVTRKSYARGYRARLLAASRMYRSLRRISPGFYLLPLP